MSDENTFELSNLYTTSRIDEGVWYEPYSNGIALGLRFKVIGISSPKVISDFAKYTAESNLISTEKDYKVALRKQAELTADFASKIIENVETSDGRKIVVNGEEIKDVKGAMKELFKNNSLVADLIIKFASSDFNYMIQD